MTELADRTRPKANASPGWTRPAGTGRLAVRCMMASMSASYHMFRAPDAPAPTAMHSSATAPIHGWMVPGATTMPTNAVKMTSDITRGFSRAKKSDTSPPPVRVARLAVVAVCMLALVSVMTGQMTCRPPSGGDRQMLP
jgi:hypothetical protein